MRWIEKQFISLIRPRLNVPFVKNHVRRTFENASDSKYVVKSVQASSIPRRTRFAPPARAFSNVEFISAETARDDHCTDTVALQKLSLSALILRLGDLRRKAAASGRMVKWLAVHKPRLIERFIARMPRLLSGSSLSMARQRVFQALGEVAFRRHSAITIRLPSLPLVSAASLLLPEIRQQIREQMLPGTSVMLLLKPSRAPSAKQLLVNSKSWSRSLDRYQFECTCDVLTELLNVPRSSNGHVLSLQ
jgi:hypothetical protein